MDPRLALRLLWRDWKGGELTLLLVALLLAVTTVSGIAIFVDRLQGALVLESSAFLAADRRIEGNRELPEAWDARARELGIATARTAVFPSMVFAGDWNQLVSVKAVSEDYPLRGTLKVADEAFVSGAETDALPAPGEAWVDGRLLPSLDVSLGEEIEVGSLALEVTRVLTDEPDRGGSFFDLGPRVLMRLEDVPATGVIRPGSRVEYALLLRGEDAALARFREGLGEDFEVYYDWDDIRSGNDSIGRALERAERFLLLGGLLAVLLSGVAVALAAARYAKRQFDAVAVLKTFGTTPREIRDLYLVNLAVLGALATVAGLVLAWLVQSGLLLALKDLVPVRLPPPGVRPFVVGSVTGFVCLLAFALPPLLALQGVSPLRVIRRDLGASEASTLGAYAAGALGSLALLVWYADSLALTGWLLLGITATSAVLLAAASVLLRTGRLVGMQAGSGWRIALAALQRRGRDNRIQILVFGLAIMLLLILYLVRTALLDEWEAQLAPDAPNHFVLNVAPYEVDEFRGLLAERDVSLQPFYPMTRGRIVAIDGEALADTERRGVRRLTSERNLSWAEELPAGNRIVAGQWWGPEPAVPEVSLEEEFARETGVEVGDVLTFSVADRRFDARVSNLREVDWDSMRPNFFIMVTPGALPDYAATYLSSFHLDAERKRFLNELLRAFPTVTVIEIDRIIDQLRRIVDRVTLAVEVVLVLVLAAGALVLVASVQSSMDERLREYGLLRALGAGRRRILGALVIEFGALGLFAGILAAVGAEVTVWMLQTQVFELAGTVHPWLWLAGPVAGMCLIGILGTLSTRRVVDTPPAIVLRQTT